MTEALKDLGEYIAAQLPEAVRRHEVRLGELMVWTTRDQVVRLVKFLRDADLDAFIRATPSED